MIFWFSGTGNSKWAAEELSKNTGEQMVEMTSGAKTSYELAPGERIGFVFPVYWQGLPKVVLEFIDYLDIKGFQGQYTYAVVTYGIAAGNVMNMLDKRLEEKSFSIKGHFGIRMIDNYIVAYDIPSPEKIGEILDNAKQKINVIMGLITEQRNEDCYDKGNGPAAWAAPVAYHLYKQKNHAHGYWVNDQCINCGKCAAECPAQAIYMESGKPVWTNQCSFCLKCLHCCPAQAIQYKKGTGKRRRYYYPGGGN